MKTFLSALLLAATPAFAGPGFVGNGDGGADLEGAAPITDGPIIAARARAVELLKRLNVEGVPGLGMLLPEVESSPLYLARDNRQPDGRDDQGTFHSDMRGRVYARTFAHPHAATRFFPVALGLSEDQLIALEVHEGLHRSLPASIAEDEGTVTTLTLAITSPSATFDQIATVASREIPGQMPLAQAESPPANPPEPESVRTLDKVVEPTAPRKPVELSYTFSGFQGARQTANYIYDPWGGSSSLTGSGPYPTSLQKLEAKFAPLSEKFPLTFSAGLGVVTPGASASSGIGPTLLGAELHLRRYVPGESVGLSVWDRSTFPVLSGSAYAQSGFARDVNSIGITVLIGTDEIEFENSLYFTSGGDAPTYLTDASTQAAVRAAYSPSFHDKISVRHLIGHVQLGGFVEVSDGSNYLYVADSVGDATWVPSGFPDLNLMTSVGPEIAWIENSYSVTLDGRMVVPGTTGYFDTFGDLWNEGSGTVSLMAKFSLFF